MAVSRRKKKFSVSWNVLNIILGQSKGRGTKKFPGDAPRVPDAPFFGSPSLTSVLTSLLRPLALPALRRPGQYIVVWGRWLQNALRWIRQRALEQLRKLKIQQLTTILPTTRSNEPLISARIPCTSACNTDQCNYPCNYYYWLNFGQDNLVWPSFANSNWLSCSWIYPPPFHQGLSLSYMKR